MQKMTPVNVTLLRTYAITLLYYFSHVLICY